MQVWVKLAADEVLDGEEAWRSLNRWRRLRIRGEPGFRCTFPFTAALSCLPFFSAALPFALLGYKSARWFLPRGLLPRHPRAEGTCSAQGAVNFGAVATEEARALEGAEAVLQRCQGDLTKIG